MSLMTIGIAGTIVFWAAFLIFIFWYKKIKNKRYHVTIGGKHYYYNYSRKIYMASIFSLAVIGYMSVIQILQQGFLTRSDGIIIWWPRFIAYALASFGTVYATASFLWVPIRYIIGLMVWIALFLVVSGVFATLSSTPNNWVHFGVGFVAFFVGCYILWKYRIRGDRNASIAMWCIFLLWGGYVATWAVSPAGAGVTTLETSWWIYFGLDIFSVIITPIFFMHCYISYKYAHHHHQNQHQHHHKNPYSLINDQLTVPIAKTMTTRTMRITNL